MHGVRIDESVRARANPPSVGELRQSRALIPNHSRNRVVTLALTVNLREGRYLVPFPFSLETGFILLVVKGQFDLSMINWVT